ncbi:hypothetical protein [Streptomyces microflavus]|uniref:hypothetical protein n=1 Tax=Streptomyces microflavus TaxID=1919 RepID=UPI0036C112C4
MVQRTWVCSLQPTHEQLTTKELFACEPGPTSIAPAPFEGAGAQSVLFDEE